VTKNAEPGFFKLKSVFVHDLAYSVTAEHEVSAEQI